MREINWNHYRTFIAVYEKRSLPQAAKILDISRSAAGQNIKALEAQMGVTLFIINLKGVVEPTEKAHIFYKETEPMFAKLVQLEKNIVGFSEESEGLIRLGCAQRAMTTEMANWIKSYRKIFKNIQVELICLEGQNPVKHLKAKEVDILVGYRWIDVDTDVTSFVFGHSDTVYIAEKNYAKEKGLAGIVPQSKFDDIDVMGVRGYLPLKAPMIYTDCMETTFQYVMRGMGAGLVIEDIIDANHPNDDYIKFRVEDFELEKIDFVCAYMPKHTNDATLAFIKHLKNPANCK